MFAVKEEIDEDAENLIKSITESIDAMVYAEKEGIRFQDLNRRLCKEALKFLKVLTANVCAKHHLHKFTLIYISARIFSKSFFLVKLFQIRS